MSIETQAIKNVVKVSQPRLMKNTDTIVGRRGCYLLDDTTEHTTPRAAIIIREDSEISKLEVNGVDVLSEYNLSGKVLIQGDVISAKEYQFTSIQLASGSAMLY